MGGNSAMCPVGNVRSFRDRFELSMLATTMAEQGVAREVRWREGGRPVRVLPAAGVFSIDDDRVREEWAYRYPHGKAALLFRRNGDDLEVGASHRAKGRAVAEILRPNALYLSAAAAAGHPDLVPLHQWFADNLWLAEASSRSRCWACTTELLQRADRRQQVLGLLHAADLGIVDARVRELDPQVQERFRRAVRILQGHDDEPEGPDSGAQIAEGLVLSHQGAHEAVEFDADEESLGTLVWFGLIGPVVEALSRGRVLLVDEIESSLHPTGARWSDPALSAGGP
jgi:uncharacterized protein